MSQSNERKSLPHKLLVEGKDDFHVIAHLLGQHSIPQTSELIDCGGIDKVPEKLINYLKLKRPQITAIGVVVDADDDIIIRWESFKTLLLKNGYTVPNLPTPTGTIITGEIRNPDIGIWIMPDNQQKAGMLEDFVLKIVPHTDQLLPIVVQTIDTIETQGLNLYRPIHRSKAKAHTWLAWQEDPSTTLGLAIKKSYLNHQAELGIAFVQWYTALFQLNH